MGGVGRKMQREQAREERRDAIGAKRKVERGNKRLVDAHRPQIAAFFEGGVEGRRLNDFQLAVYRHLRTEGWDASRAYRAARACMQLPGHTQIPPRVPETPRGRSGPSRGFHSRKRGSPRATPRPRAASSSAPPPEPVDPDAILRAGASMSPLAALAEPPLRPPPLKSVQFGDRRLPLKKG
jgi:hypothetical protein